MGFVKTPAEIAAIKERLADVRYVAESLSIGFRTTPEFAREVLPPCLEPLADASGMVTVAQSQSVHVGEHTAAAVYLGAQFEGIVGWYALSLLISTEINQLHGRERWGMAKKRLDAGELYRDGGGDHMAMFGYATRVGTRVIEIDAELGHDLGVADGTHHLFEVKAHIQAMGTSLDKPKLLIIQVDESNASRRVGSGRITLRGTPHDPLDSIPIQSIQEAAFTRGELRYNVIREVDLSEDPSMYEPYVFATHYDDFSLSTMPLRYERAGVR
jgi:acetoacetate decarboxylase